MSIALTACASFIIVSLAARDVFVRLFGHRERLAKLRTEQSQEERFEALAKQVEGLESELRRVHLSRGR